MRAYADTNALTGLYLEVPQIDQNIARIRSARRVGSPPLPVTWLHRFEVPNAFEMHVFLSRQPGRVRITPEQAMLAHAQFREDIAAAQIFAEPRLSMEQLEAQFETLCLRHTARHGFRTYDLLHVSSALILGCDEFWSFDTKACKLARLEGLRC